MAGPKVLLPLLYGDARTPRNTLTALGARQLANGFVPGCRTPGGFYGAACEVPLNDAYVAVEGFARDIVVG